MKLGELIILWVGGLLSVAVLIAGAKEGPSSRIFFSMSVFIVVIWIAFSGPNQPLIPEQKSHPFRRNPASVPEQKSHPAFMGLG
jgi:hypothetical protein